MTKEESKASFKKEVNEASEKQLKRLHEYMLKNYSELSSQFLDCFKIYCQKIIKMQESNQKASLGYIQFSLMRTKLIENVYEFRIDAYNENWYADKKECVGVYDVSKIFAFLECFSDELLEYRRKYMQKVTVGDVKQYVLEESDKYKLVVIEFIRSIIPQVIKLAEYKTVKREDVFAITVGEYLDVSELVHKEDKTEKDIEKVIKHLTTKQENAHQYEILDKLEFKEANFEFARWLYCSGVDSKFIKSSLSNSTLMFCNFESADLELVNFTNSDVISMNFENATLKDVSFENARLFNVTFKGATLENIDFTVVNQISGINLEDATLINVSLPEELEVV